MRALVNELQMLLHEHPVNEQRAAHGQPTVNSVWLWGAGASADAGGRSRAHAEGVLVTDDPWLAGIWRWHGGRVRPPDEFVAALDEGSDDLRVALTRTCSADPAMLRQLDDDILAPARSRLAASPVSRVSLHAGRLVADVTARARWTFWRRTRPLPEVLA